MIDNSIRQAAVKRNDPRAYATIFCLFALHVGSLFGTLVLPWPAAILAAVLNGIAIGQLFIVGHDTCHLSYFSSKRANRIMGRLVFLPTMTPFSIWHVIHNVKHHGHSNVRHLDGVWEPISLADYEALPVWRRLLYRFYRSHPGVFGYYFIDYWVRQFVWPRRKIVGKVKLVHCADVALCWAYGIGVYGAIFAWASTTGHSLAMVALVSILIPQATWNALMSLTIYLQHTHPDIAWFQSIDQWHAENGRLSTTAYVRIPRWMSVVTFEMMEHPAHHFMPGVPLYNLRELNQALPPTSYPSWRFSFSEYCRVVQTCKFYDFEARRWVPLPA